MSLLGRAAEAISRRTRHLRPSVIAGRRRLQRESRRLLAEVESRGLDDDASFKEYLFAQIRGSLPFSQGRSGPMIARTRYLLELLADRLEQQELDGASILCVGCRDGREIDALETLVGTGKVTGLDLFSRDPRIEVGDMHKMPFADGTFDGLYSCHNLEHSFDLEQAVGEFLRVVRPGGWLMVEVPVRFQPSATDRQDVGSVDGLVRAFSAGVAEVLVAEESSRPWRDREKTNARMLARRGPAPADTGPAPADTGGAQR